MSGLFNGDNGDVKVIDKIWKNKTSKYNGCVQALEANTDIIFITWFEDTQKELQECLLSNAKPANNVLLYRHVNTVNSHNRQIIFAEHFPLRTKELDFLKKLSLAKAMVYSSLDEPLFTLFGGARISTLLEQLGMHDEEAIEHTMISKAILNMQKKMEEKIMVEQTAMNMEDWIRRNYVS